MVATFPSCSASHMPLPLLTCPPVETFSFLCVFVSLWDFAFPSDQYALPAVPHQLNPCHSSVQDQTLCLWSVCRSLASQPFLWAPTDFLTSGLWTMLCFVVVILGFCLPGSLWHLLEHRYLSYSLLYPQGWPARTHSRCSAHVSEIAWRVWPFITWSLSSMTVSGLFNHYSPCYLLNVITS